MSKKKATENEVDVKAAVEQPADVNESNMQDYAETMDADSLTPEQMDAARVEMRKAMKERFGKWMEIADENATDEDIEAARKVFETKVEEWRNKTFAIATAEDARETLEFLKEWNTKYNRWEKGAWRGVVAFDNVVNDLMNASDLDTTPLEIDYQTLIFLNASMAVPSGVGIESARQMAELENYDFETNKVRDDKKVTYSSILTEVFRHVKTLQAADKMLNLYRERITIAAAGIKCDFKITELEEFTELHEAWVVNDSNAGAQQQ